VILFLLFRFLLQLLLLILVVFLPM
jgi:hypothetical protein